MSRLIQTMWTRWCYFCFGLTFVESRLVPQQSGYAFQLFFERVGVDSPNAFVICLIAVLLLLLLSKITVGIVATYNEEDHEGEE